MEMSSSSGMQPSPEIRPSSSPESTKGAHRKSYTQIATESQTLHRKSHSTSDVHLNVPLRTDTPSDASAYTTAESDVEDPLGSPRGGLGSPRGGLGSPRGGLGSPRSGLSSPAESLISLDISDDVDPKNRQLTENRQRKFRDILDIYEVKDIAQWLDGKISVGMTLSELDVYYDFIDHVLEKRVPDYLTFLDLYGKFVEKGVKSTVIDKFLSSIPEGTAWDIDEESKKAVLESLSDENILRLKIDMKGKFKKYGYLDIIRAIKKRNPYKHTDDMKQLNNETADIMKSQQQLDCEWRVQTLEETLEKCDKAETQEIFLKSLRSNMEDVSNIASVKHLKAKNYHLVMEIMRMANAASQLVEQFSNTIAGVSGVSGVKGGFIEAGAIMQSAQESTVAAKDIYVEAKGITKKAAKEMKKRKNAVIRMLNQMRISRRKLESKSVEEEMDIDLDIENAFKPQPLKRATPINEMQILMAMKKKGMIGAKEILHQWIGEAKISLATRKVKDDYINNLTSLIVDAMTVKVVTPDGELVGRIVEIPSERKPRFWRKIRDLVSSAVDGKGNADANKLFAKLYLDTMDEQFSESPFSKATQAARSIWLVGNNFGSEEQFNSILDAIARVILPIEPKGLRTALRVQYGKLVCKDEFRIESEDPNDYRALDISDARAIEVIINDRREYEDITDKIDTQLDVSDKMCQDDIEANFVVRDFILQVCRPLLTNMIGEAKIGVVAGNYREAIKNYVQNTPKENIEIDKLTKQENALNEFLTMEYEINEKRCNNIVGSDEYQEAQKKLEKIQQSKEGHLREYPSATDDTYVKDLLQLIGNLAKAGASVAALVALV